MENREILFRGKRIDNGEWTEGGYGILGKDTDLEKRIIVVNTLDLNSRTPRFYFTDVEVASETVGQYTGLKDKNGAKVFESDNVYDETVDLEVKNGVVFWDNYLMCWSVKFNEDYREVNIMLCDFVEDGKVNAKVVDIHDEEVQNANT